MSVRTDESEPNNNLVLHAYQTVDQLFSANHSAYDRLHESVEYAGGVVMTAR